MGWAEWGAQRQGSYTHPHLLSCPPLPLLPFALSPGCHLNVCRFEGKTDSLAASLSWCSLLVPFPSPIFLCLPHFFSHVTSILGFLLPETKHSTVSGPAAGLSVQRWPSGWARQNLCKGNMTNVTGLEGKRFTTMTHLGLQNSGKGTPTVFHLRTMRVFFLCLCLSPSLPASLHGLPGLLGPKLW